MRRFLPSLAAVICLAPAFSQTPEATFPTAPGWEWLAVPRDAGCYLRAEAGMVYMIDEDHDGAMIVILARGAQASRQAVGCRPVVFDAARKRYPLQLRDAGSCTGSGNDVTLQRFRLAPEALRATDAKFIAVEVLTPEGQPLAAEEAAKRAKAAGVEVLPLPRVGVAFDFVLSTVDGRRISSRDLRGRVVLVDCWATWCAPCMTKMPKLKELYQNWHKDGFEVIGVSFDESADKAVGAAKSLEIPWPMVHVPADRKTRDLWFEASGIRALPRLLLIDRNGVLRADCHPNELEEAIEKLMKRQPTDPGQDSP